ncbi:MAG: hypothetical protein ACKPH4_28870 [Microcystis panniformis]
MKSNLNKFGFLLTVISLLGLNTPKAQAALLVAGIGNNAVFRYNETTGVLIDSFIPPGSGGLDFPGGLTIGTDNNLYVASLNNNSVLRYNGQTGAFINAFVSAGSGGLERPFRQFLVSIITSM